jgi:hypothetical protein
MADRIASIGGVTGRHRSLILLFVTITLSGCVNANDIAMKIGRPPAEASKLRALETRTFDTQDTAALLSVGTQTMQDLGFIVSESSVDGALLTASKQRDAHETGQVVGQVALTVLFAAMGAAYHPVWDENQTIEVTLVVSPVAAARQSKVRVSFDRIVLNSDGQRRAELIQDAPIYEGFFKRFETSMALEAKPI